jgi:serine/threonine-protein kinase
VLEKRKGLWGSVAGEIYSAGVMLYALFTKRYPYKWSFYRNEYLQRILQDSPLSFAECERSPWPELERLLRKAMAKDPKERFQSASEFLVAVHDLHPPDSHTADSDRTDSSANGVITAERDR